MFIKRPAFTLFEMLITLTVFSVVAVISVTLLVNGLRAANKVQAQVLLYSEAQALMDQISRDIERNTVDYEAYYARAVRGNIGWNTPDYGKYAQSFFDPGTDGVEDGPYARMNTYGSYYGTQCPNDSSKSYPLECPLDIPEYEQQDTSTGAHPFTGIEDDIWGSGYDGGQETMNAFCESDSGSTDCTSFTYGLRDELILINAEGDERTVYTQEQLDASTSEYFLSRVGLTGTDSDGDGVVDTWSCSSLYSCTGPGLVPNYNDLTDTEGSSEHDFVPLTPSEINIEEFHVLVSPLEDPYRGPAELDSQMQPQITIILKATLSSEYHQGLLGEVPSITIQRTISTGVYSSVLSYQ